MVKDDSRSCAVFTEQGSSASQMTAAKVMDIINSRLPGCAGQAADAVSVCTQLRMEDAPKIFQNSKIGTSRYLDTSTQGTSGQNHGPISKIQSFLLNGICTVIF